MIAPVKFAGIALIALILAGCNAVLPSASTNPTNSPQAIGSPTPEPGYTLTEVATHNSADSCWIAISGYVYDVTKFIPLHPGGEKILTGCGKDMTEFITTKHKPITDRLPQFSIGPIQQ